MQLTTSKKIMGGLALAGTLLLTTGVAGFAQQGTTQGPDGPQHERHERGGKGMRGMGGGFLGRFAQNLNLTDAQKEQMQQIAARHRESTKALRQQTGEKHGGDFGALNGGAFDEAAVRAAAQARANAHVEMEVAQARMMAEMYAVLTAEQKAQIATQRQQWEQKRQERRAPRGGSVQNQ